MGNGYKYGFTGPPFNFLGHFCTTQFNAFSSWVNARTGNFPSIQQFYQIRAAQLRKTAGALNQFYSKANDEVLTATFDKNSWKPAPGGQFGYVFRDDQIPMVAMSNIKEYMRPQLQRQDESVFTMNQIRNIIEKTEDKAQFAWQAVNDPEQSIASLLTKINGYFSLPEYEAVLVSDQTDVYPAGSTQPRFRVHQLDVPTQYEIETTAHANPGQTVNIKEVSST